MIERGDIRWATFRAPDKRRPVLVLGRAEVLESMAQVPVIPLSTNIRSLRWEVRLTPMDGLPEECVLKPEWIKTIERTALGRAFAILPASRWKEVQTSLLDALGLDAA